MGFIDYMVTKMGYISREDIAKEYVSKRELEATLEPMLKTAIEQIFNAAAMTGLSRSPHGAEECECQGEEDDNEGVTQGIMDSTRYRVISGGLTYYCDDVMPNPCGGFDIIFLQRENDGSISVGEDGKAMPCFGTIHDSSATILDTSSTMTLELFAEKRETLENSAYYVDKDDTSDCAFS